MHSARYFHIILWFLIFIVIGSESTSSDSSARCLDSLLQQYAFKALRWPRTRTGIPYDACVPSNLSGIQISSLMLTKYSLKWRSYGYFKEFFIPSGVLEEQYIWKVVLVYQNLANWSSFYYPLPGYTYLTPILGILPYSAYYLSAENVLELDILALEDPIAIRFSYAQPAPEKSLPKCVYFYSDNLVEFGNVTDGNVCLTRKKGHFAIVSEVKVAPSPSPVADDITPSPSPAADVIAPSPSPAADDIAPSPSPTADDIAPSPSPAADDIAPSPSSAADDIAPSPSPAADDIAPGPSPATGDITPSPSPAADQNNHRKINSIMWAISLGILTFALFGISFVIVNKCGLLAIRHRLDDSATLVEPLLGNTEAP